MLSLCMLIGSLSQAAEGDDGEDEGIEVDAEGSTDGAVLVNGNEGDEQWGTNTEATPTA